MLFNCNSFTLVVNKYLLTYLLRFQEFKCKAKSENSDSVAIDLQKLKDVLQNDTKYYILENIK